MNKLWNVVLFKQASDRSYYEFDPRKSGAVPVVRLLIEC